MTRIHGSYDGIVFQREGGKKMTRKQQETKAVKEALKSLPYRVKVRHGIGTGSGWIKIYIPKKIWINENELRKVENLAAAATGRPLVGENHIIVMWYE